MNDNPTKLPTLTQADLANPDVVRTLEQALAGAKAGKVVGVALVTVLGPDRMSLGTAGAHPSTMVAGCAKITAQMLDLMFNQRRTSLMLPGRG